MQAEARPLSGVDEAREILPCPLCGVFVVAAWGILSLHVAPPSRWGGRGACPLSLFGLEAVGAGGPLFPAQSPTGKTVLARYDALTRRIVFDPCTPEEADTAMARVTEAVLLAHYAAMAEAGEE